MTEYQESSARINAVVGELAEPNIIPLFVGVSLAVLVGWFLLK